MASYDLIQLNFLLGFCNMMQLAYDSDAIVLVLLRQVVVSRVHLDYQFCSRGRFDRSLALKKVSRPMDKIISNFHKDIL